MDAFPKDLLDALNNTDYDKPLSTTELVDKNQDGLTASSNAPQCPALAPTPHGTSQHKIQLPAEILLYVLNLLSIPQLLPCQRVSKRFRAATRTVLMDRLGGPSHLRQCPVCRQHPYLPHQQLQQRAMSTSGIHLGSVATLTERELARIGGGLSLSNTSASLGLPPLPQNHQSNLNHPQQPIQQQQQQQHQLHHHLYQRQDPSDAIHHQTDLHLHHPPLHQYIQRQQFHHDAGYVAPGTLALFLFPHHDHTPTGWQDRQAVHLHCMGVDRAREQLIFQPMVADRDGGLGGGGTGNGAVLRFNTNSWNLPTFGALSPPTPLAISMASTLSSSSSSGSSSSSSNSSSSNGSRSISASHSRSSSRGSTNGLDSEGQSPSTTGTGLDLFDYTTGQPRQTHQQQPSSSATTGSLFGNSEQSTHQDERSLLGQHTVMHTRSPSVPSSSTSYLLSSSSSSSTPINANPSTAIPSWSTVNGTGSEHYSVIGVKHGDWPEDRQAAGRWWGGGLQSSMTHESMVFLPWARGPGGDGSVVDHQQRMLRQEMEHVVPATRTLREEETRHGQGCWRRGADGAEKEKEEVCTKVHVHKMYLSSSRAHRQPRHHHRFLCLHHDQLMADIATSGFSVLY